VESAAQQTQQHKQGAEMEKLTESLHCKLVGTFYQDVEAVCDLFHLLFY
jgi:hypothetical protein